MEGRVGGRVGGKEGGKEKGVNKVTMDFLWYMQNEIREPVLKLMAVTGPQSW